MQKLLIALFLLSLSQLLSAQESNVLPDSTRIYEMFDTTVNPLPSYPGGEAEMYKYIQRNIQYPAADLKKRISGVVAISFVIDETGAITQAKLLRDLGSACGAEGLRLVNGMPRWSPGMVNGKPVKVKFVLPIRFKLG